MTLAVSRVMLQLLLSLGKGLILVVEEKMRK